MRSSISAGLKRKALVSERIAWNAQAYLSSIDANSAIARHAAECELRMLNAKRSFQRTESKAE